MPSALKNIPALTFVGGRNSFIIMKGFLYFTDLPNASVHAVIAAQSFHWFVNDKSISEIHRVLARGIVPGTPRFNDSETQGIRLLRQIR